ncbi:hypothetical protein SAMN05192529_108134 [Arachidicoccus rhizosphaerae]|uniref:Uncharacterized protein n=1 Tax=Arachidicoccus rhizosphaerae TaxID=551991 RepID=A0A1H3YK20_9BACT|nr:hypothetical protein SAMN05192529_108134 [Arachidicoccus rhizosphaerae]
MIEFVEWYIKINLTFKSPLGKLLGWNYRFVGMQSYSRFKNSNFNSLPRTV